MKTCFRPVLAWWITLASILGIAHATLPPTALTLRELAQGYREHRILVRPKSGWATEASQAEQDSHARLRREFARFGHVRVLELDPADSADRAIARLRATGLYATVERDVLRYALVVPNDPSFARQWSLHNTGQTGGTSGVDIGATTAWNTRTDGSSVIVAIVDSGIRLTHSDLAGNLWTSNGIHGINAIVASGSAGYNDPTDDNGHGTHVAGIIGAVGDNGIGISGVGWQAKLMALKFIPSDGGGSLSDELECIQFAISHNAKIINASFGSSSSSSTELAALKSARDAGIIFVAAAGNGIDDNGVSADNDTTASFPANYPLDNIVSVAATTSTDALASYSNYGGLVDLGAPGDEIYSTYNASDSSYATLSGTSMAAPHVTGALAMLWAQFPNDSYRQIINRLLRSSTKTSALNGRVQSGGRLNLAQAITSTVNRPFNDSFTERATLAGANVRVRSSNVGATLDNGEPAHAGATGGASLWWTWTATDTTQVAFDTAGSTTAADAPLDTLLAVYTGTSVSALQAVGSNDDANGAVTSRVLINATAGTTYQIAVDGKNGATGMVLLRIGAVPVNDNFANATTLTGDSFSVSATLLNASGEAGEPNPSAAAAGNSVWYKWTAPKSGHFLLAAFATQTDTIAAVYTGSSIGSLTLVASNNDSSSANSDALVPFNATSGTTYYFSVDHAANDGSSGGDFVLTLNEAAWEYPTTDEVTASPAVGADGTVYFGAGSDNGFDTNVYAVTSSGTLKWTFATGATGVIGASPAIGGDGTVYVGGTDMNLYALDGSTGAKKWSFAAGTMISSTPAIAGNGTIYFRDDTKLYALTGAGAQSWSFALADSTTGTYSSPAVGANGTIYVGTNTGSLYAVNPDGTQKWKYSANENVTTPGDADIYTSPAIAADGTIYFANLHGTVYAISDNGTSAAKKWSWTTSDQSSVTSSIALGADGTLYFAGYDHKLHALNSSGSEKWSCPLGDEVRASSPAVAADGTIYVGCYDGLIYAISSAGTVQRTYATAKPIRSSPAIANRRLYIGSADAKLYAIDLGQSAVNSAWPMFQRNPAHTGLAGSGAPAITSQPQSQTVVAGGSATLTVAASGSGSITYQWFKDGSAIAGATGSSYTIANATSASAGTYTVTVTNSSGSVTSAAAVISVAAPGSQASLLVNISTRAYCGTGDNVTIGGFVVSGTGPKRVLVRAVGPSLTAQGLASSEVLADPTIEVHQGSAVIATNDNWGDNANASDITSVAAQLGAAPLQSGDTKSSALLLTLQPGVYTFVVNGKGGTAGIVLLEVYDADTANDSARFVNIASRADCTTGDGVAIGGFVITGSAPKKVLLRAMGPTLATQGISAGELLADPTIELHHGSSVIGTNDNWGDNANASDIVTTGARVGATPFAASDHSSAALLMTLQPGVYTFIAQGKAGATGIVLVEVYDAD